MRPLPRCSRTKASRVRQKRPARYDAKMARDLLKLHRFVVRCIVHQDIDPAQLLAGLLFDHRPDALLARDIGMCRANARTPRLARSITVCCASRAQLIKGDRDIRPGRASASADARPNRFRRP